MRRLVLSSLLLLLLPLAGCLGDDAPVSGAPSDGDALADDADGANATTWPFVYEADFSLSEGVGFVVNSVVLGGPPEISVTVPEGADELALAAAWTCTTGPACRLMVEAYHGDTLIDTARGDNAATLTLPTPAAGAWTIRVWPDMGGAVVKDASGTVTATATAAAGAMS